MCLGTQSSWINKVKYSFPNSWVASRVIGRPRYLYQPIENALFERNVYDEFSVQIFWSILYLLRESSLKAETGDVTIKNKMQMVEDTDVHDIDLFVPKYYPLRLVNLVMPGQYRGADYHFPRFLFSIV